MAKMALEGLFDGDPLQGIFPALRRIRLGQARAQQTVTDAPTHFAQSLAALPQTSTDWLPESVHYPQPCVQKTLTYAASISHVAVRKADGRRLRV